MIPIMIALLGAVQGAAPTQPEACSAIPQDSVVQIEVVDAIDSRTAKIGDHFAIRLFAPLAVDGKTLLPVGTPGIGEVIHAQHKTFMTNRPGELLVAARYLVLGQSRLPLRGFRIAQTGHTVVVPSLHFIPIAQNTSIPAGSMATAKVAGSCAIPPSAPNAQDTSK